MECHKIWLNYIHNIRSMSQKYQLFCTRLRNLGRASYKALQQFRTEQRSHRDVNGVIQAHVFNRVLWEIQNEYFLLRPPEFIETNHDANVPYELPVKYSYFGFYLSSNMTASRGGLYGKCKLSMRIFKSSMINNEISLDVPF